MRHPARAIALAAAVLAPIAALARDADACSATQTQVYQSATTVWCVEQSVIAQYGAFPTAFFPYGENVIKELAALFNVPAQGVYTFEASVPNGSAHTGSECCGLGVTVTGDAFYNDGYGATGFWGYLLSLHETINDWTGQVTSGWPTDFWADHVSAFPNSMDWHVMATLGALDNDANLVKASAAQKARFYPGGDSVDPRVPMFDTIFALPTMDYTGMSRVFGLVQGDQLSWDGLGVPNPDEKRSEYVVAYLSLGAGQSVLPVMRGAGVCAGKADGQGDPTYTCQESNVDAIANAHCAIVAAAAQGADVTADLKALRGGDYASVAAKGTCGAGCPGECGCKSTTDRCVAPWLADAAPDGGAADAGAVHDAGAGGGHDAGTDAGAGSGGHADAGLGGTGDGGGGNGASGDGSGGASAGSGCGCQLGDRGDGLPAALAVGALAAIGLARSRAGRRARGR